jgi:hypothetical protein
LLLWQTSWPTSRRPSPDAFASWQNGTQRRFPQLADEVATIAASVEEHLKLLRASRSEARIQADGGRAIPEEWEVYRLGQLSEFVTSGSRGWAKYYSDSGLYLFEAEYT